MADPQLPEEFRREVFRALVEAQDRGLGSEHSREVVAADFGLSAERLRSIEREGIDANWPPLD